MHFFISGRICDYPLHNLSLSYTPPKNVNRLPTKTNFSTPIARDPCRLKAPIQSLIIQWSALFWFLNLERSAKGYYVREICVCIMLDLGGGDRKDPLGKLKYHSDYPPPTPKKNFFLVRACVCTHEFPFLSASVDVYWHWNQIKTTCFNVVSYSENYFYFIFISVVYSRMFFKMNAKPVSWPFLVQNSYCLFYTFLWLRRWDRTHLYTCETTNGLRYFAVFLIRWTHPLLTLALYTSLRDTCAIFKNHFSTA